MRQRAWNEPVMKILLKITAFGKLLKQVNPEYISDGSKQEQNTSTRKAKSSYL